MHARSTSPPPRPALLAGYHAPLDLYPEFHRIAKDPTVHTVPEGWPVTVCVGKEWHRYPSSFFLPNKSVSLPVPPPPPILHTLYAHFLFLPESVCNPPTPDELSILYRGQLTSLPPPLQNGPLNLFFGAKSKT